jgi:hypothetical protein
MTSSTASLANRVNSSVQNSFGIVAVNHTIGNGAIQKGCWYLDPSMAQTRCGGGRPRTGPSRSHGVVVLCVYR